MRVYDDWESDSTVRGAVCKLKERQRVVGSIGGVGRAAQAPDGIVGHAKKPDLGRTLFFGLKFGASSEGRLGVSPVSLLLGAYRVFDIRNATVTLLQFTL